MYKEFYKLRRHPFEITPDPSFMFLTRRHREALATLYYGVQRRKGFVVLTGEVGTGKTLLIGYLLRLFKESGIACAYIFNSRLSSLGFLQYVALDLGLPTQGNNKARLLHDLNKFLIARYQKKLTTVIVVDEAHHLGFEVLEEVRLLTNLETADQKLVQVLLVGQPELAEKLESFQLRQLKQRIALRTYLEPLDLEETKGYIQRRLQVAGAPDGRLIPDETIAAIYRYTGGIPRLINTMCENALITTFSRQLPGVSPEIIKETARDLCLEVAVEPRIELSRGGNPELNQAMATMRSLTDRLQSMPAEPEQCPSLDTGLHWPANPSLKPYTDS